MKLYLDGVLVVEGKEDACYLSNYISSEIVILNGFELDEITISYLKNKRIIALLDPDEAGIKIRQKLNNLIPNIINVEIDIKRCTKGKKNGVAECEIEEVLNKLRPYSIKEPIKNAEIKKSDIYNLGLITNKELRDFVCEKLNLGKCNGKTLYRRLLVGNVKLKILEKVLKEYNGN